MKTFDHNSGEYLQTDDAKIYYEITGEVESPILLMLHGGFGTMDDFNPIISELESKFKIIGIDSRGQGKSTLGKKVLTYEQIQHDVERILEHLKIDNLSIIGFSDGGIVGHRLATLTSLKIEKLVTIGSRWHLKNTEPTKEIFLKITGESWRTKFPDTYEIYQRINPEPDFDCLAASLVKMWLDENPSGYPNEAVENINCPLLIVRGDDDHLIPLEASVELKKIVKGAKFLNIPFAGHAAFVEQKDIFMMSLNEFFRQ